MQGRLAYCARDRSRQKEAGHESPASGERIDTEIAENFLINCLKNNAWLSGAQAGKLQR
jgi:hypothetical protein